MIETYKFERFVCVYVCVCVCVFMFVEYVILFLAHKSLAISRVTNLPSVDIEREYASKSGAGDAGVVFL